MIPQLDAAHVRQPLPLIDVFWGLARFSRLRRKLDGFGKLSFSKVAPFNLIMPSLALF